MPDVVKHAHTHRPREEGGTDPIVFPTSGSGLPTAIAKDGLRSQTASGNWPIDFRYISWNDSSLFGYAVTTGGSPNRARFITINQEGTYDVKATVSWTADWPVSIIGPSPLIEPSIYLPSGPFEDILATNVDERAWDDSGGVIYGQQITTAEHDHHMLVANCVFAFDFSLFAETTIGIGVNILTIDSPTRTIAGSVVVTRLGELGTLQTIT